MKEHKRCRLCAKSCCTKPAKVSYRQAAHDRGEDVSEMDAETQWWFECYSCRSVCACEV